MGGPATDDWLLGLEDDVAPAEEAHHFGTWPLLPADVPGTCLGGYADTDAPL
eukprot:CAMPEP_0178462196 /NCGR_PEP_ID=MMETSP0689_2-20121128/49702_1 /TAXON_ID=160604 /ORGANISM="Amphidinium massartii, Strain CS-259" /LENGTH=51 /DNA_ID=CAMNT_0020089059 /DNA_START=1885 /DNA_END=2037 /DNA_ORIENTATION=-